MGMTFNSNVKYQCVVKTTTGHTYVDNHYTLRGAFKRMNSYLNGKRRTPDIQSVRVMDNSDGAMLQWEDVRNLLEHGAR